MAEGVRVSSLARIKGHKEDTVLDWVWHAARQAEAISRLVRKTLGYSKFCCLQQTMPNLPVPHRARDTRGGYEEVIAARIV